MSSNPVAPTVRRGEIWMAELEPVTGHEQGGRRPCLVISNNLFNGLSMDMVIVLPLTGTQRTLNSHVGLSPPEGGLTIASDVLCEQIRSVSKTRLVRRMGDVSAASMNRVQFALKMILSLDARM